jgi:hypothetical protein
MHQHPYLDPGQHNEAALRAQEAATTLGAQLVNEQLLEAQRAAVTQETMNQLTWQLAAQAQEAHRRAFEASQWGVGGNVSRARSGVPPPSPVPLPPPAPSRSRSDDSDDHDGSGDNGELVVFILAGLFILFILGLMVHFFFIPLIQGRLNG